MGRTEGTQGYGQQSQRSSKENRQGELPWLREILGKMWRLFRGKNVHGEYSSIEQLSFCMTKYQCSVKTPGDV
jgi:hypothetical protein